MQRLNRISSHLCAGQGPSIQDNDVLIVAMARTPIGSFNGALKSFTGPQLGALAVKGCFDKLQGHLTTADVDEVFLGNVLSAGLGQAPARQAALAAGIGENVPCTTVNKVCSSGLKAVMLASSAIQANQADVLVAGGFESMSNVPFYNTSQRTGKKFGNVTLLDGLAYDGLRDAYNKQPMGNCGELCADSKQITRQQQDDYAVLSYKRSQAASKAGHFKDTIVPVTVKTRRKTIVVTEDEEVWRVKDFDKIRKLRPAFRHPSKAEAKKTVTAANASTLSDGAASVVLISGRAYKKLTNKPKILARVLSYADAAQAPEWFTTAPVLAVNKALQRAKLTTDQIDLYELNEAFSVVALACSKQLNLPIEKVNVLGGSVSIGHPLGASGCRILVTLLNALQIHNKQYGCVGICNGGGGASAIVVERVM